MQIDNINAISASAQAQAEEERRKKRRRRVAVIIAVIALLIAALVGLYTCSDLDLPGRGRNVNAEFGQLDGKTEDEIQAELNRVVDESMFDISIMSGVEFEDGQSEGEWRIENVPGNQYLLDCVVTEAKTGDVLYESGLLEPNHHITKGRLLKDLDAGVYPCIATFTAYDMETEEETGKVNAEITVVVKN